MDLSKDCTSKVFTRIKSGGKIQCDKELTGKSIDDMIRKYFALTSEEKKAKKQICSGHSLRVGYCVSAYDSGAKLEDIRVMGGWLSDAMPIRYTRKRNMAKLDILNVFDY